MTKAGKIWSWLAEKLKGSRSSKKDGPPYKGVPPTPFPKVRSKSGYSLVIISASGSTRQIELTPLRVRLGLCLIGGVICVLVVSLAWTGAFRFGRGGPGEQSADLADRIEKLQEELKQKDLALSVYEKRMKEMQETPTLAAIGPRSVDTSRPTAKADSSSENDGPLMALQESSKSDVVAGTTVEPRLGEATAKQGAERPRPAAKRGAALEQGDAPGKAPSPLSRSVQKGKTVSFDAQDVAAVAESPNNGTLSFRLIKDSPETRFSGYLFVFVEMADPRGENKIWAYPNQTRLGEEDLPADFRDGETVSFKYNSRVELPYADTRPGASLAKVSILLYSENGKIVFQRGFDRREVRMVSSKEAGSEGTRPRAGVERRRAL